MRFYYDNTRFYQESSLTTILGKGPIVFVLEKQANRFTGRVFRCSDRQIACSFIDQLFFNPYTYGLSYEVKEPNEFREIALQSPRIKHGYKYNGLLARASH